MWTIDSVEIAGGFVAGLSLRLPPGLTCIIGPRGSGKSTLVEGIRYAIAGISSASKSRLDLMQANFSQAVITIRTAARNGGSGYTIRRALRQAASLVAADGSAVTSVDLDRGTFLPLDAYSAAEIESIADESFGDKRRSLLDELRNDDLQCIQLAVAEKKRSLEANADAIRAAIGQVADLTERIEELAAARTRLAALPAPAPSETSQPLVKAAQQHQVNQQEDSLLAEVLKQTRALATAFADLADRASRELKLPGLPDESQNRLLMDEVQALLDQATAGIIGQATAGARGLKELDQAIRALADRLKQAHEQQEAQYVQLQAANRAAGQALRQRHEAEQAVSGYTRATSSAK